MQQTRLEEEFQFQFKMSVNWSGIEELFKI